MTNAGKRFFSYFLPTCNEIKLFLLLLTLVLTSSVTWAQTDTIGLKNKPLNTSFLKTALKQYLVYNQDLKKDKNLGFWFWLRDIRMIEHNGEKVFATTQHWYGSDSSRYREIYSLNKATDFSPLYHAETVHGRIKAYNWFTDKIAGADSVQNNVGKDFFAQFLRTQFQLES